MSAPQPIKPAADYVITCTAIADADSLQSDWQTLQSVVAPPFFLDWLWIGTWLDTYDPDALIVRVSLAETVVALGIFSRMRERRHILLRSSVALLHQTGLTHQDQIWIEYNGLLAAQGHETPALALAIQTLQKQGWCDEVHLSMLPEEHALALQATHPASQVALKETGFQTDLGALRQQQSDVIDSLSSNTRHQVRRSLRRYTSAHGSPMQLVPAGTLEEALGMFGECGVWHRTRWQDSGFNNPAFVSFHETVIKRGFDHGRAQLFRIVVGEHVIGVFYFLVSGGHVYFYLQGIEGTADAKLKPGLCAHALLMQHFLDQGYNMYDFMGGESQYKQQLSNQQNAFTTLRIHNGRWPFLVESRARKLKQRLLGS